MSFQNGEWNNFSDILFEAIDKNAFMTKQLDNENYDNDSHDYDNQNDDKMTWWQNDMVKWW